MKRVHNLVKFKKKFFCKYILFSYTYESKKFHFCVCLQTNKLNKILEISIDDDRILSLKLMIYNEKIINNNDRSS